MPDPSVSDALAEAAALAPADEVILHTLEIRHPAFVDEAGNPTSIFVVQDTQDLTAPLEAGAPVRGGEWVRFVGFLFSFALMPIEPGTTPEIEITVDGIDRSVIAQLDRAAESSDKIIVVYRPYLDSDLADGPQMDPPPSFELSEVHATVTNVKAKARTGIDLRGNFPRRNYKATEFPGLVGQ